MNCVNHPSRPSRADRHTLRASAAPMLLALVLTAAACKDSPTVADAPPDVSGSWSGTSQGVALNLTLSEGIGGAVSGSGNIAGGTDNLALIVRQGTHVDPNLSLILGATGYEDMNFAGRLSSETQMTGTLNGSGFDNFNFNLTRR
jgi:hypothetical protein